MDKFSFWLKIVVLTALFIVPTSENNLNEFTMSSLQRNEQKSGANGERSQSSCQSIPNANKFHRSELNVPKGKVNKNGNSRSATAESDVLIIKRCKKDSNGNCTIKEDLKKMTKLWSDINREMKEYQRLSENNENSGRKLQALAKNIDVVQMPPKFHDELNSMYRSDDKFWNYDRLNTVANLVKSKERPIDSRLGGLRDSNIKSNAPSRNDQFGKLIGRWPWKYF